MNKDIHSFDAFLKKFSCDLNENNSTICYWIVKKKKEVNTIQCSETLIRIIKLCESWYLIALFNFTYNFQVEHLKKLNSENFNCAFLN